MEKHFESTVHMTGGCHAVEGTAVIEGLWPGVGHLARCAQIVAPARSAAERFPSARRPLALNAGPRGPRTAGIRGLDTAVCHPSNSPCLAVVLLEFLNEPVWRGYVGRLHGCHNP